ncbi:MAG: alpha/beta hydrolase [Candidatus Aquilonibacter sp.]|jgi:pimeloyl-ACP methyl ester carboxylesterase
MLRSAVIAGLAAVALATGLAVAQDVTLPALGIALEGYAYPYPVQYFTVVNDGRSLSMAYMDVAPAANANGRTVVLMHGKNFGGYYFRNVIARLSAAGYRVIVPDQIGWGKSPKPDIHYSFQQLAANTSALLDSLRVGNVAVLGHSTGGMLAVRFALMYPQRVTQLILEDPVGLEDYRLKIPAQSDDTLFAQELNNTKPAAIEAFYAHYFAHPTPSLYEPLADVQIRVSRSPDYEQWARASALAYQMIYQQPVRYEYHRIAAPTLIIVGAEDRTVPMGTYAPPEVRATMGNFPELAREAAADIPHGQFVIVSDSGHIPHLEQPEQFFAALLPFLRS